MNLIPLKVALLRAPLFPFERLEKLLEDENTVPFAIAVFFTDPAARDALAYMSPTFYDRVEKKILEQNLSADEVGSLLRYAIRLCSRSTPLGWSASCSVLSTSEGDLPVIDASKDVLGKVTLDASLRYKILDISNRTGNSELQLCPNDTIWKKGHVLRYIKLSPSKNGRLTPTLTEVKLNPYLECILDNCNVPSTPDQLAICLVNFFPEDEFAFEEALMFVNEMHDAQLLTTDHMLKLSSRNVEKINYGSNIGLIDDLLMSATISTRPNGNLLNTLRSAKSKVDEVIAEHPKKAIFEITSWRNLPSESGIPVGLRLQMTKCIEAVLRTCTTTESRFSELIERWDRLYGDADIPLMRLTDEIDGLYVGVEAPNHSVLSVLPVPFPRRETAANAALEKNIRNKVIGAIGGMFEDVVLSLDEILKFELPSQLPSSVTGWFKIWSQNETSSPILELSGIGTWPVGRLFGRFSCHDDNLKEMLVENSSSFASENTVIAELIFHPRERIANVCQRPTLSEYEIGIRTGIGGDAKPILLEDIIVCRVGERLRLRSRSLGKWVHLNFSTAHNHDLPDNMRVYRFLVELVEQDSMNVERFNARSFCKNTIYAPRIRIDNVIVGRASWHIFGTLRNQFLDAKNNIEIKSIILELQRKYKLPMWVSVVQGDNHLALNLSNDYCLRELVDVIRKQDDLLLIECSPVGMKSGLSGVEGHYHHELLVAFDTGCRYPLPPLQTNRFLAYSDTSNLANTYDPGSEWLYMQIYAQPKLQNKLLGRLYSQALKPLIVQNQLQEWFFVRYHDSDGHHIRLRIKSSTRDTMFSIFRPIHDILEECKKEGLYRNIKLNTYATESNRYGGDAAMPYIHTFFSACSELAAHFLDQYSSIDYPQIVVDVIRAMMDGFGFPSGSDRLNFTRISARGYAEEYNFQADARKQVNLISKKIISRFERKVDNSENQLVISTLISACATLKDSLTFLEDKNCLSQTIPSIFRSLLHMQFNRLLSENPRAQEAVYWDIIRRVEEYAEATRSK